MDWDRLRILERLQAGRVRPRALGILGVTVLIAALVGLGLGMGATRIGRGDQVVVGNTGGTASVVLSIGDSLVVIGGGDSRADLPDFVDRSTLPWRRHVDLMIVPAADTQHVAGAVGLIEHGTVTAIAILGDPGDDPTWALLRSEADHYHTTVKVLTGQQRLVIAPGAELSLDSGQSDDPARPGPSAVLSYGQARIAIVDWPTALPSADATPPTPPSGDVLISLRPDSPLGESDPSVFLRATPYGASVAGSPRAEYAGDVGVGQRVTLNLRADQIRLSAGAVSRSSE